MENQISLLIILFVWALNFGISWFNARTVGLMWVEIKHIGGWQKFMGWMGAIMSASGFTWCYLIVLLVGTYYFQPFFLKPNEPLVLTIEGVQAGLSLGYIIILPGILLSGFMIWINSLIEAWRNRSALNIGVASWNTFAQVHNTYRAMQGMPEAWKSVTGFFSSGSKGDSKSNGAKLVIFLVIIAVLGGILTTWGIINKYAGTKRLPKAIRGVH